jgi:TrmH family RNA methyltransferase
VYQAVNLSDMRQISSKDNPKIKQVIRLMSSAKERRESGLFVLEGLRLCADLLRCSLAPLSVFLTKSAFEKNPDLLGELIKSADNAYFTDNAVFSKIADTDSPQGVICVVKKKEQIIELKNGGKYVFLCNVADPANLGTISRSAEALGIDGLLLNGGCDFLSPKALRASMGSLLRLPVIQGQCGEIFSMLKEKGIKTFASTPRESAEKIGDCDFSEGGCILIGNEANGLDISIINMCDKAVTIPMKGRAESLNAAAAASILIYEMMRE